MAMRVGRTSEELIENSSKLLSKIWMFAQTGRLNNAPPQSSEGLELDEQIRFLAVFESHLIHARELMRFLYADPTKRRRDDIAASDYVDDPTLLPQPWDGFEADLDWIDKELAHLSYVSESGPHQWSGSGKLTAGLLAFVKLVPTERVQEGFRPIAGSTLADQSDLAALTVAPSDGSHDPVRGHRVHELFERS